MILEQVKGQQAQEVRRQQQQGLGRPIVSNLVGGFRLVAVGDQLHYSDSWVTFHDFLREFIWGALGKGWSKSEWAKPFKQRHQIVQWADQAYQAYQDYKRLSVEEGEIRSAPATGAMAAFLGLSYNLYLTAHNVAVQKALIERLKNHDGFWGALYETYVAAAFINAGFSIDFENERDGGRTHCEFVATDKESGQQYSVEAKARDPVSQAKRLESANEKGEQPNYGLGNKLYKALRKHADHPRVVFIELNLPIGLRSESKADVAQGVRDEIRSKEGSLRIDGEPAPPAYVFVTNHPFHHRLDSPAIGPAVLALGYKISDFGFGFTFQRFREYVAARNRHMPMNLLTKSIAAYHAVPSTFDGDLPELAFNAELGKSRLEIGRTYLVPDAEGKEVPGRLEHAIMMEDNKEVVGVYRTAKNLIQARCPVNDEEIRAYRAHPDTFFGRMLEPMMNPENEIEYFDFVYESYQHTPREQLLEFLREADDFEALSKLSQGALAIEYCERITLAMIETNAQRDSARGGVSEEG